MRTFIASMVILGIASAAAANVPPTVSNVVALQRGHTALVDVTYDLADPDHDPSHITFWYSIDGGATWDQQCITVWGDVGPGVQPATGLTATWDAGADVPDFWDELFRVRVYAEDSGGGVPPGFVRIDAGTFVMGSPDDEYGHMSDEDEHTVTLTTPFFMAATEVTNQQYAELAQWALDNGHCTASGASIVDVYGTPSRTLLHMDGDCEISYAGGAFQVEAGKEDDPVIDVTWFGAAAYCDWLNLQASLPMAYGHTFWACNGHDPYGAIGYRLPTEAEWEYACRAGTTAPFNTGGCLDAGTEANYNGGYPYPDCPAGPSVGWLVPVASYPANAWGVFDAHGNLLEWCNDCYGAYGGDEVDPVGPWSTLSDRVVRGGSWYGSASWCRSARRESRDPAHHGFGNVGFRPVRSTD